VARAALRGAETANPADFDNEAFNRKVGFGNRVIHDIVDQGTRQLGNGTADAADQKLGVMNRFRMCAADEGIKA